MKTNTLHMFPGRIPWLGLMILLLCSNALVSGASVSPSYLVSETSPASVAGLPESKLLQSAALALPAGRMASRTSATSLAQHVQLQAAPGQTVIVTTNSTMLDGDISSIAALTAQPGADGRISFAEALAAANSSPGNTIRFDLLSGSVIPFSALTLTLLAPNTTIDGDTNGDQLPDVALGSPGAIVGLAIRSAGNTLRNLALSNISIEGVDAHDNQILNSYIGLYTDGRTGMSFGNGLQITNAAHHNRIEQTLIAGNTSLFSNGISASGIYLDSGANNNTIRGNRIGVLANGQGRPNTYGVTIAAGAYNNTIGGSRTSPGGCDAACNLISANDIGISISGPGSQGNQVLGNVIGTNSTGDQALSNRIGIFISNAAQSNRIGGTRTTQACDGPCNLLSGNQQIGLVLDGVGTEQNRVQGNYIGSTITGDKALPNGSVGIMLQAGAGANQIGDLRTSARCTGACNVIAGHTGAGIALGGAATQQNLIRGNLIGLGATGTRALPNYVGVRLFDGASHNTIGGERATMNCDGACNAIIGNSAAGMWLYGASTQANQILGNAIGLNGGSGIAISSGASQNTIGAAWQVTALAGCHGPCNEISGNAGPGMLLLGATSRGNSIRGNAIFQNRQQAIDLGGDGVTLNHEALQADGPNAYANAPMSLIADFDGTTTHISGVVASYRATEQSIDIYASQGFHSQGSGEAQYYLGTTTPDAQGEFRLSWTGRLPSATLAATATDHDGNTSELSTRTPVIFVPGVSGSELIDRANNDESLWFPIFRLDSQRRSLSMRPEDNAGRDVVAPDVLRYVELPLYKLGIPIAYTYVMNIYGPFLEALTTSGYRAYQINRLPERRTFQGCDYDAQKGNAPSLFVFAYDWRQDNDLTAARLADYVRCVQRFYPGARINLVAHSMGGVVSRRYILKNPEHHIGRLITIATPWLGAPKQIYVIETGEFVPPLIAGPGVKYAVESMPAAYQLLPSRRYYAVQQASQTLPAMIEQGSDFNGNGSYDDQYSYTDLIQIFDLRYPRFRPGTANQQFHDLAGQDSWQGDSTGVKYFMLYGVRARQDTIGQVRAYPAAICSAVAASNDKTCAWQSLLDVEKVLGDKTVPVLSASANGQFAAEGVQVLPFVSPSPSEDALYDHVELPNNPLVSQKVQDLLIGSEPSGPSSLHVQPAAVSPRITITSIGAEHIDISDALGYHTQPISGTLRGFVAGVEETQIGDNAHTILLDGEPFTVTLRAGPRPMMLDMTWRDGDTITQAIRYRDLSLPNGTVAMLQMSAGATAVLRYDADGDGRFETSIPATTTTTGAQASDSDGPVIRVQTHGSSPMLTVQLSATDSGSGVKSLYVSLDAVHFQPYTQPFTVDIRSTAIVYAFADDGVANRRSLAYPLAQALTTQTLVYLPIAVR